MSRHLGRLAALLVVPLILVVLAALLPSPSYAGPPVLAPGSSAAQRAFDRVQSILGGHETAARTQSARSDVRTGTGTGTDGSPDLTLALRDLAQQRSALPSAERIEADRILARPTAGGGDGGGAAGYDTAEQTPVCSPRVCVHYVLKAGDKDTVEPVHAQGDSVPTVVRTALATFSHVDQTYVAAGYRAPLGDGTRGGDARPDIYLADIGDQGLYGYCTSDAKGDPRTTWAYCVVDNDFSRSQFPTHTPVQNLQVTAAHEYFHAVQFGYDYDGDAWFMEATATWAEDEVYTDVNDNRQYLASSPISDPRRSMDQFFSTFHYGTWIFFRYLTERFPTAEGGLPTLVRDMWRLDDVATGGPGEYSLQAIGDTLVARGTSLSAAFTGFSVANRMPGSSYSEGTAYPSAPLAATQRVSPAHLRQPYDVRLNHLTSATVRYQATRRLTGAWKLHLTFDLAPRATGSAAAITINPRNASRRVLTVPLDARGDATRTVDLSRATTKWVEVTLVDAGTQYRHCGHGTRFSCGGTSRDDREAAHLGTLATKS